VILRKKKVNSNICSLERCLSSMERLDAGAVCIAMWAQEQKEEELKREKIREEVAID